MTCNGPPCARNDFAYEKKVARDKMLGKVGNGRGNAILVLVVKHMMWHRMKLNFGHVDSDGQCVVPTPTIPTRRVQFVGGGEAPLVPDVIKLLKSVVNAPPSCPNYTTICVYVKNKDPSTIYIPARASQGEQPLVYQLGIGAMDVLAATRFVPTNVTIRALETYVPSALVYWSRAIIFRTGIMGERFSSGVVHINNDLFGVRTHHEHRSKRQKR